MEYLFASLQYLWSQIWPILKPSQPLSWRTLMSLCIFSWLLALITSDAQWPGLIGGHPDNAISDPPSFLWFQMSFARWVLFTMGWVFLCLSMAWLLSQTRLVVPFFDISIFPGVWVVGLLTSTYLFLIGPEDFRSAAVVAWPLISAIYTLFPKIITSTGQFQAPNPKIRQQFIIIFLASATVSCWLQFSVVVQEWVIHYPVLLLAPLEQSTFVTPLGAPAGVVSIAKESLDQTVQLLPIPEVRQWIKNVDVYSEAVNDRFQSKLNSNQSLAIDFNQILQRVQGKTETSTRRPTEEINNNDWDESTEQAPSPTHNNRVVETWKMTLEADPESTLALRLQLRALPSLQADNKPKSPDGHDIYIEYLCRIKRYIAQDPASENPSPSEVPKNSVENRSEDLLAPEGLEPESTSELAPTTPDATTDNVEQYRQNSLNCKFMGMYKRP